MEEPFTRRVRALERFRELVRLWIAAGDLQYYWRPVLTRDAGGRGSFWMFRPYFYMATSGKAACGGVKIGSVSWR